MTQQQCHFFLLFKRIKIKLPCKKYIILLHSFVIVFQLDAIKMSIRWIFSHSPNFRKKFQLSHRPNLLYNYINKIVVVEKEYVQYLS